MTKSDIDSRTASAQQAAERMARIDPRVGPKPRPSNAVERFFNALFALIYVVVSVGSWLLSFAVLPLFGYAGFGRILMAFAIAAILVVLFWVVTKIIDVIDF